MTTDDSTALEAHDILVIADDLAGAAESAAAVTLSSGAPSELRLGVSQTIPGSDAVLVIDTDSRYSSAADARTAVRAAVSARPQARLLIKKVDSLLRGRIADEATELRDQGVNLIASFALPSMRRTVTGGVVHLDGVPLHDSDAWAAEKSLPPRSVPHLLGSIPVTVVPLATVRSDVIDECLLEAISAETVPVCDAEEQRDLEMIADATLRLATRISMVGMMGTGALARAVGRRLRQVAPAGRLSPPTEQSAVLVVVGTVASTISEQLRRLIDAGACAIAVSPEQLKQPHFPASLVARTSQALRCGVAVVYADRTEQWHRDDVAVLAASLRELPELGAIDLVLTGGETARRVLDAVAVSAIYPEQELADGVVLSRTVTGTFVVTRPGSFGNADSLVDIVAHLRPAFSSNNSKHKESM